MVYFFFDPSLNPSFLSKKNHFFAFQRLASKRLMGKCGVPAVAFGGFRGSLGRDRPSKEEGGKEPCLGREGMRGVLSFDISVSRREVEEGIHLMLHMIHTKIALFTLTHK